MQSLPIPVTQTKMLNLSDAASKGGSSVNKASAENAKVAFQMELNKQVRAKQNQAQAKQDKNAESVKSYSNTPQKSSVKDQSEVDQTAQAGKGLNKQLDVERDIADQIVLDDAKDPSQANIDTGAENKEAAVADLISSLGIPSAQGLQNTTNNLPASPADGALLATSEFAIQQKNLMAELNSSTTSVQPQQLATDADIKAKPSAENLVDNLTARPEIKLAVEDSASDKAIFNLAKDLPAKELLVKDAVPNAVQTQAASINSIQNSSNVASQQLASANVINVYPGKSGWDQAISQKVVWMVGTGQQSASLTLNPPDLGPLKVVISVHNDQADTTFISDNDEVRKALESGMSHLRDKMNESGIQLGQANVSTSQQSQQDFQQAAKGGLFQGVKSQADAEGIEANIQAKVTVRVSDGLVDTFA